MSTPVIPKRQQKQSLASAKKSVKKTPAKGLRNVLAQPFERYWPVVGLEDVSNLAELLKRTLPGLKRNSQSLPWALLRKMDKEERLEAQKKAKAETQASGINAEELKSVTMGVNAVTRDLEKENICSILLDSTVESLLIKHVVVMAQNKRIPILLVPFLKKSTLEHIGFASAAMGLKKTVSNSSHAFHELHKEIVKLSQGIPSAKEILFDEEPKIENDRMSIEVENTQQHPPFTLSTNIYKFRSTRKERTFVPPSLTDKSVENQSAWTDFIALGKDDFKMNTGKPLFFRKNQRYVDIRAQVTKKPASKTSESISFGNDDEEVSAQHPKKQRTNDSAYVSLKVKRIQGNNNRAKATKAAKQKKKIVK